MLRSDSGTRKLPPRTASAIGAFACNQLFKTNAMFGKSINTTVESGRSWQTCDDYAFINDMMLYNQKLLKAGTAQHKVQMLHVNQAS